MLVVCFNSVVYVTILPSLALDIWMCWLLIWVWFGLCDVVVVFRCWGFLCLVYGCGYATQALFEFGDFDVVAA